MKEVKMMGVLMFLCYLVGIASFWVLHDCPETKADHKSNGIDWDESFFVDSLSIGLKQEVVKAGVIVDTVYSWGFNDVYILWTERDLNILESGTPENPYSTYHFPRSRVEVYYISDKKPSPQRVEREISKMDTLNGRVFR